MTKIKQITETVHVVRDGFEWGEYVTAGDTYTTTRRADGKGDVHFWSPERNCGTFMRPYQFARAVKAGWVNRVAP